MADYTERANEEFVEAITRIKESKGADKEANEKVTELLLNGTAQFLMPVMITDEPAKERKILYGVIAGKDGQPFYMLFTSKQKIKEWNKEGRKIKTVTHTFEEAANKAVGDPRIFGFVINPVTDDFIIGRAVIQDLLTKLNGKAFGLDAKEIIISGAFFVVACSPVYRSIWMDKKLGLSTEKIEQVEVEKLPENSSEEAVE